MVSIGGVPYYPKYNYSFKLSTYWAPIEHHWAHEVLNGAQWVLNGCQIHISIQWCSLVLNALSNLCLNVPNGAKYCVRWRKFQIKMLRRKSHLTYRHIFFDYIDNILMKIGISKLRGKFEFLAPFFTSVKMKLNFHQLFQIFKPFYQPQFHVVHLEKAVFIVDILSTRLQSVTHFP